MKKRKIFKIIIGIVIILFVLFTLTLCGGEDTQVTGDNEWAVYFYLCGSNLESEDGAATVDLSELLEAQLPENVKVVIETGGASQWQNDTVSAEYLERYVYDSNGLALIEQQPSANMGSQEALSDFLSFAKSNYPAEKTAFIFWNHGGGSVGGAAFDELYDFDSLTLDEMYSAFSENYELSDQSPPFELIGFDTCLMASLDVANTFSEIGKYLVASEELEPGNGWYYTGWANALASNPKMDGLEFGTAICDTYQEGSELVGTQNEITLSVTNLSKVKDLVKAYDNFGREALLKAVNDAGFFSTFGRIASATENYGGNTKEQGFTNMVDMGHLARQSSDILPDTSAALLTALDQCVAYKINGPYRAQSTGLSCYYSYNGDLDNLEQYVGIGAGEAFKYFYDYSLTGKLSEAGRKFIATAGTKILPSPETLMGLGWENHEVTVDESGSAILTLGEKAADVLTGIYVDLYYVDPSQDLMILLGTDNDLYADWETGTFKDNFRGVWGGINGNLVYMEVSYEGDDYNLYAVPILLNGEEYNLSVVYDFNKGSYAIQGARKALDENGMADKYLRKLIDGDVITTIHYAALLSGEGDDFYPIEVDQITVSDDLVFEEVDMGDGMFMMMYKMVDLQGNMAYSDMIMFETTGGEITTTVGFVE